MAGDEEIAKRFFRHELALNQRHTSELHYAYHFFRCLCVEC